MRLISTLLLTGALAATPALAGQPIDFAGDRYAPAFQDLGGKTDRFIEFIRAGETVETWSRLVVLHWLPEMTDPRQAARHLAEVAEARDSGANPRLSENPATSEALVHFMATSPGSKVGEVNVFRYAKAKGGRGVVAVQYTFHFTIGADAPAQVVAQRLRAVGELQRFDMTPVTAFFRPTT